MAWSPITKPNASSKNSPKPDALCLFEVAGSGENTSSSPAYSSLCLCALCVNCFFRLFPRASVSGREIQLDVRAALKQGISQLRAADVPSFTLAAELLLLHVLGHERTRIYSHPEEKISPADADRYFALIARRASGEPTQHLTRKQEFWGLEFEVTNDVLIPRPETEHLIEVALDRLAVRELRAGRKQTLSGDGLQIADIGTGSGCIAIALARDLPGATI